MKIFYFTATGNCLEVSKKMGGELYSIPRVLRAGEKEFAADKIGLVFPCYFGGTPLVVTEFLEKVKLKSNYIFAVITYGNFSAGATDHFAQAARKNGLEISYLNELMMIDNYLPFFDVEKQLKNAGRKKTPENLNIIRQDVVAAKKYLNKSSSPKKLITYIAQKMYINGHGKSDRRFSINDKCTLCKTCAKVCPAGNITLETKPLYQQNCWGCLACIHLCPHGAIDMRGERSKARYRNSSVSVKEIIEANSTRGL